MIAGALLVWLIVVGCSVWVILYAVASVVTGG